MMNDASPGPAEAPKVAVIELSVAISGVGPAKLYKVAACAPIAVKLIEQTAHARRGFFFITASVPNCASRVGQSAPNRRSSRTIVSRMQ
jgi:hypothetical protein